MQAILFWCHGGNHVVNFSDLTAFSIKISILSLGRSYQINFMFFTIFLSTLTSILGFHDLLQPNF